MNMQKSLASPLQSLRKHGLLLWKTAFCPPKENEQQASDGIVLAVVVLCALAIRLFLVPYQGLDYQYFLRPWMEFIRSHGGYKALANQFTDYSHIYPSLLVLVSYLPIPIVWAVKVISLCGDLVLAYYMYRVTALRYHNGPMAIAAVCAVLFAPTVILNGAYWGQCDVLYATGLVASLCYLLENQYFKAFVAFGIAFSIKLQSIFFIPVLYLTWLYGNVPRWYAVIPPAIYLITAIPSWIIGRPMRELLLIYFNQTKTYRSLTLAAPNIYTWISNEYYWPFMRAGIVLCGIVTLMVCFFIRRSPAPFDADLKVRTAVLSVILVPLLLPSMHERYFFAADVLTLVLALYIPRLFWVPVVMSLISLFSYVLFLFGLTVLPQPQLAIVTLFLTIYLTVDLMKDIYSSPPRSFQSTSLP
jgi:Gpi18-like mannosyltransferase